MGTLTLDPFSGTVTGHGDGGESDSSESMISRLGPIEKHISLMVPMDFVFPQ